MSQYFRCASLAALVFTLGACSEESTTPKGGAQTQTKTEPEWTRLVEGSWTLPAGGELTNYCVHQDITEDTYISAIRPVHPLGTHHTLLTASDAAADCNFSVVSNTLIYGAGVGSEGLTLPDGVAMKIPAGKVLNLGLHLYNTTTEELTGTSAIEVVLMKAADVRYEAEAMLAGPFDISIPPYGIHTQSGDCPIDQEQTIFAIFPHMHQLGTHFKATFIQSGQEIVLHDGDYSFQEQYQIPLDNPLTLEPGDIIRSECTWNNPTANTVTFGESSDTEMCFDLVFQYPARGKGICGSVSTTRVALDGPPCAAQTDTGNELGVGRYCTAGGGECTSGDGAIGQTTSTGSGTFCLADFTSGDFGDFCSTTCTTDADCGTGAVCTGSTRKVCFPAGCVPTTADAGVSDAAGGG